MNNDYGTFLNDETLQLERILPGTPELIWGFLTESDKKGKWLAHGDVEPVVGGKVTQHFNHKHFMDEYETLPEKYKNMKEESTSYGKVTVWDPYSLLSYTWDEGDDGVSEVVFELTEIDDKTVKLVLTHKRIPDSMNFKVGVSAGWHTHLNILRDTLSGIAPSGFWKYHMPLEAEYEATLNKMN